MSNVKQSWWKNIIDSIKPYLTVLNMFILVLFALLIYGFFQRFILKIVIWPSLITMLIVAFKDQLSQLINRVNNAKLPGGIELSMSQETAYESGDPKQIIQQYADANTNTISQQKKEIEDAKLTQEQLIQHISLQNIAIDFERIYNLVFKSQIDLLWLLLDKKQIGLSKLTIENYFESQIRPKALLAYVGWTWQSYVSFLTTRNLIAIDNATGNFVITDYGSAFLEYLIAMNYKKNSIL